MARSLRFLINEAEYAAAPVKLDRKKLYGWSETIALDENGRECKLVSMDETGTLIIPKGGLGLGVLSPDRRWIDRGELKAVDSDGKDAPYAASSYEDCIRLDCKVTAEEYLDYSITALYQLDADPALIAALGDEIYTFDYHYNAGYAGHQAFLITNEGVLFMLLGFLSKFDMVSLEEVGSVDEDEPDEEDDEGGDIDFSMF